MPNFRDGPFKLDSRRATKNVRWSVPAVLSEHECESFVFDFIVGTTLTDAKCEHRSKVWWQAVNWDTFIARCELCSVSAGCFQIKYAAPKHSHRRLLLIHNCASTSSRVCQCRLQLILSDIWDAVARIVLSYSQLPIIPSSWTSVATDPAANTHSCCVFCQMVKARWRGFLNSC